MELFLIEKKRVRRVDYRGHNSSDKREKNKAVFSVVVRGKRQELEVQMNNFLNKKKRSHSTPLLNTLV